MSDPEELWDCPDLWKPLASRDITGVFGVPVRIGWRQRDIADRTGLAQSEVSAIINGRQVQSIRLLERIAAGLGIPKGRLGLSDGPAGRHGGPVPAEWPLVHAGRVLLGRPVFGEPDPVPVVVESTPTPNRVGPIDVEQLDRATAEYTRLYRQWGGGLVLPAIEGHLRWATRLLSVTTTDPVRAAMAGAVAALHRRVAGTAFDVGDIDRARAHLKRAMSLAAAHDQTDLLACVLYSGGRIELHHGPAGAALKLFQLAAAVAFDTRLPRLKALIEVSEARAWARLGDARRASCAIAMAHEHHADRSPVPGWLQFFDDGEFFGGVGEAWSHLGEEGKAIAALRRGVRARGPDAILYRAFDTAELAAAHLRDGELDEGARAAGSALSVIDALHSRRARTRLGRLAAACQRSGEVGADLLARMRALRPY